MSTFIPFNDLERALEQAQAGVLPIAQLVQRLLESDLAVPSGGEVFKDGRGFQPLLFQKSQTQMLACFTDKRRIGDYAPMAPYCLEMTGRDLLRRLPPGFGLVINPGWPVGFDMSPEGIATVLKELA